MEEKQCTKCGEIKPISEFYKKRKNVLKYTSQCKTCILHYRKQNMKEYLKKYNSEYHNKHKNKLNIKRQERAKIQYHTDSYYRLSQQLRCRLRDALTYFGLNKNNSHIKLLGCDKETLFDWLQKSGEKLDIHFDIHNYDRQEYHVDHIKTFADVKAGIYTLEEVCHYTNLQILPKDVNLSKGGTSW